MRRKSPGGGGRGEEEGGRSDAMRCGRPTSERHSLLAAGTPLGVHGGTCTRYRPHGLSWDVWAVYCTVPRTSDDAVTTSARCTRYCTWVPARMYLRTVHRGRYIHTHNPPPPPARTAPSAVLAASWDSSLRVGRPVELVLPSAVERSPSSRLPPESISCLCAARLPSRSRFHRNPHAPSRWAKPLSS
jgi:hypothetical protein